MGKSFDVIVVGARCAGSPLAMLLARRGLRVLLVDRATFPSDTLSGHNVQLAGTAALARWGLYDAVAASGAPRVTQYFADLGEFALCGSPPTIAPGDPDAAHCIRRTVLDYILLEAAVRDGAEFRDAFNVRGLIRDGDRVTGIEGSSRNGGPCVVTADVVVGADGMRSFVARAVGARIYRHTPALTFLYYSYFEGVAPRSGCAPGVHEAEGYLGFRTDDGFPPGAGMSALNIPTNGGANAVSVSLPVAEFQQFKSNVETNFLRHVDKTPVGERLRSARRVDRFYGTADLPNFYRRCSGPGWALVGDAAFFKDPVVGHGIADAFVWAESLAEHIATGLGDGDLDRALAAYAEHRDRTTWPDFDLAVSTAHLRALTPTNARLLRAVASDPDEAGRYFGTVGAQSVDPRDFFSADNIRRLLLRPVGDQR